MKQFFVLLVDDDPDDRAWFLEALFSVNKRIHCEIAADGSEALEILLKSDRIPDYIFLDMNLPKMNGKEFLKRIKQQYRFADIPVIVYSTSRVDADIEYAKKLGALHYITKPVDFERTKKSISYVFEHAASL